MGLFSNTTNEKRNKFRKPDESGRVTDSIGVAVWRQHETGDHDIKVGEFQPDPDGNEAIVRTTTPLSKLRDHVVAIGIVAAAFAAERSVPDDLRNDLEGLADSIEAMFSPVREDALRHVKGMDGKSNGLSA